MRSGRVKAMMGAFRVGIFISAFFAIVTGLFLPSGTASSGLVFIESASAQTTFRCSGRVQFRPCGMPYPNTSPAIAEDSTEAKPSRESQIELKMAFQPEQHAITKIQARLGMPKILNSQFRLLGYSPGRTSGKRNPKSASQLGEWRGVVHGDGDIGLELAITKPGSPPQRQFMGSVKLKNKATWFVYRGSVPTGKNWSWSISAFPRVG